MRWLLVAGGWRLAAGECGMRRCGEVEDPPLKKRQGWGTRKSNREGEGLLESLRSGE
jgi:hypothetical protein